MIIIIIIIIIHLSYSCHTLLIYFPRVPFWKPLLIDDQMPGVTVDNANAMCLVVIVSCHMFIG